MADDDNTRPVDPDAITADLKQRVTKKRNLTSAPTDAAAFAGATAKEIAAEVGMTVGGLRNRCIALGANPMRERARRGEIGP